MDDEVDRLEVRTDPTVKWAILGGLTLVLLLWLATTITVVGTGKVGVVTRFGKVTGREIPEGISLKAPWPINRVHDYDVKIQKEEAKAAAASKDLQDVNSTLVVNYEVDANRVSEIHQNIGTNYQEKLIDPALQEGFKSSSAKFTASQLITDRSAVKEAALNVLRARLEEFGIRVVDLSIVNFSFSDEFTKAIEAKQVAQQEAERANFDLRRALLDAKSQRAQRQTLSPLLLQKWAIERWNGQMPTYVGGGSIFNIPLSGGR